MKWSKLRKLVEDTFADSVQGRVQVYSTTYQGTYGRGWFTVDGEELVDLSTLKSSLVHGGRIYHEATKTPCSTHPAVADKDRSPGLLVEPGEFSRFDLHEACWQYLHDISLNDALASSNPLLVSLAILNRNVAKERLRRLANEDLHPLARALLSIRMEAEEIVEPPAATGADATRRGQNSEIANENE